MSARFLARVLALVMTVSLLTLPQVVVAEPPPVAAVNTGDGFALHGYDPVAYFTLGEATPGTNDYIYSWQRVTYRFASADNLARFKNEPEKYLPQYGGYCAYAMSLNRIADIDPDRWAIVEDKLYLNNNFFAHTLWSVNKSGNIASADKNWAVWPKIGPSE